MPSTEPDNSQDDSRLNEILARYRQAAESGQPVDQEQFVREHAEFADELREVLADKSRIDELARGEPDAPPSALATDAQSLPPKCVTRFDTPTIDSVATPTAGPHAGAVIRYFGDYELLEEIARGGMGVVYKARQVKLHRVVAIKMILSGQLAGKENSAGFLLNSREVSFSPDGRRLVLAFDKNTADVWDLPTSFRRSNLSTKSHRAFTLDGHTGAVPGAVFSPDDRRIATASHNGTVRIWDAGTGQEVLTLRGHADAVQSVAFSPNGRLLASADSQGTVIIWDGTTANKW